MSPEQSLTMSCTDLQRALPGGPRRPSPAEAADALMAFLRRKRPGLAALLKVQREGDDLRVTARGEHPEQTLQELRDLLTAAHAPVPDELAEAPVEVDPELFRVEVTHRAEPEPERVVLQSRVRSFPYPVCEWFDISTGLLTLTESRLTYEPEDLIMDDRGLSGGHMLVLDLAEIRGAYRGTWWDLPCVMLETEQATYRYGWPARRDEPELEFDAGEWIGALRTLLPNATSAPEDE